MRFLDRYSSTELVPREVLWEDLEWPSSDSVRALIRDLEAAVSSGYFGLAAQISDHMLACGSESLKSSPDLRVRLMLEQMKRLFYMGFSAGPRSIGEKIVSLLQELRGSWNPQELDFWEFEALGYRAWTEDNPKHLTIYLERCEKLAGDFSGDVMARAVLRGFLEGTRGRYYTLIGEVEATKRAFSEGMRILRENGLDRSLAHLEVYYAEHLAGLQDWKPAAKSAREFLKRALGVGFRSHLVLRAVLLLLQSPDGVVSQEFRRQLGFRCWVLVHAMGVSQLGPAYPLLERGLREAGEELARSPASLLFETDLQAELLRWLTALSPKQTERVLCLHYETQGYRVTLLPKDEVALDLLAFRGIAEEIEAVGIQVKHFTSSPIYKKHIPDEMLLSRFKEHVRLLHGGVLPTRFHWHCTKGIHVSARELLDQRLKGTFGEAVRLFCTDAEELVRRMLVSPESLPRVILGVEIQDPTL